MKKLLALLLLLSTAAYAATSNTYLRDDGTFHGVTNIPGISGAGTFCLQIDASGNISNTGAACGTGGGAIVNSVSNSDGTLTISPTTGAVVASLALGHANTWTAVQTHNSGDLVLAGATSGTIILNATAVAGANTATLPANTGTIAELNLGQTWTATQIFPAGSLTGSELANQTITATQIANATITNTQIASNTIINNSLAQMPANTIKANNTGGTANAADVTLTATIDADIGSTRGAILERGASGWVLITPGTSGNILTSNGAGTDPTWSPPGGLANNSVTNAILAQMPPDTVKCNNTSSTANAADCTSIVLKGTTQFLAPTASSGSFDGILDTTAVLGVNAPAAFWTHYNSGGSTPGNPVVHFTNRLMVGEYSTKDPACHTGAQSWLLTFFGANCESGQIAVTSTLGTNGITVGVRTSDFGPWHGFTNNAPNSEGINAFAICDETGSYTSSPVAKFSLCESYNAITIVNPGTNSIGLGMQLDLSNGDVSVTQTPYSTIGGVNTTYDLLLTAGGFSGKATKNNTAALAIVSGDANGFLLGPYWNTGILIAQAAITVGAGPVMGSTGANATVAIGMAETQDIVWYHSDGSITGAIFTGGSGNLNLVGNNLVINGSAAVSCVTINPGSMIVTNGIVTHC